MKSQPAQPTGTTLDANVVLEARGVSKCYVRELALSRQYGARDILRELRPHRAARPSRSLRPGEFWAVDDVSLTVRKGESVGVLGANGAGKSSLLRVLQGVSMPTSGTIRVAGRSMALINLGSSMVSEITGRQNISSEAALLGLNDSESAELVEAVIDFAELGEFIDAPLGTYSSGMRVRLAYAIAAQSQPDLLLVDEDIAVGDLAFQRKCVSHVHTHLERGGALILVSHDMWMINALCERCIVMESGRRVLEAPTSDAIVHYLATVGAQSQSANGTETTQGSSLTLTDANNNLDEPAITSIRFVSSNGGSPTHGEPALVEVNVYLTNKEQDLELSVALIGQDQRTTVLEFQAMLTPGPLDAPAGQSTFHARFDRFPLFSGTYFVQASLRDRDGYAIATFGRSERMVPVKIAPTGTEFETIGQMAGSLSSLRCDYEVVESTDSRQPQNGRSA